MARRERDLGSQGDSSNGAARRCQKERQIKDIPASAVAALRRSSFRRPVDQIHGERKNSRHKQPHEQRPLENEQLLPVISAPALAWQQVKAFLLARISRISGTGPARHGGIQSIRLRLRHDLAGTSTYLRLRFVTAAELGAGTIKVRTRSWNVWSEFISMSLWRLLVKPFRQCSSLGQITVILQKGEREIEADR